MLLTFLRKIFANYDFDKEVTKIEQNTCTCDIYNNYDL